MHDIADEMKIEKPVFDKAQVNEWNAQKREQAIAGILEEEIELYRGGDLPKTHETADGTRLIVPAHVEQQISAGIKQNTDKSYKHYTGQRSQMFDHLLDMELEMPASMKMKLQKK